MLIWGAPVLEKTSVFVSPFVGAFQRFPYSSVCRLSRAARFGRACAQLFCASPRALNRHANAPQTSTRKKVFFAFDNAWKHVCGMPQMGILSTLQVLTYLRWCRAAWNLAETFDKQVVWLNMDETMAAYAPPGLAQHGSTWIMIPQMDYDPQMEYDPPDGL
jgi:hypothetical protein